MKHIKRITDNDHSEIIFVFLMFLTAVGTVAGAIYISAHDKTSSIWIHQYFIPVQGINIKELFLRSFIPESAFLAAFFLMGTSAVGQPVTAALMFYRGSGAGAAAAMLYCEYGIKAIPSVTVLIVPEAVMYLMISVVGAKESFHSSNRLLNTFIKSIDAESRNDEGILYIVRFIVLNVISIIIAAADAVLNYVLGDLMAIT